MKSRGLSKRALAAIVAGVLIGGGVTAVSPAGAEVSQAAATNWKKIWKKKLQPLADKRYYTKSASDAKYSTKAETSTAFANYYTKAQSDAAYALKGSSYTKAESDAKYQPVGSYATAGSSYTKAESDGKYALAPKVIRGMYTMRFTAAAAGANGGSSISFGINLAAAPTAHFIPAGGVVPAGCSGTPAAPSASAGHLCVFQGFEVNSQSNNVFNVVGNPGASTFGAYVSATSVAGGITRDVGSWALGVGALSAGSPAIAKQLTPGIDAQK